MVTHLLLFTVVTADIMNIGSFGDRVKNKSMKKFHAGSSWDSNPRLVSETGLNLASYLATLRRW